uniref:LRAT domain-containing protein n=1 Tax=Panagrolaimus sp. ES5 TaxID=591445 RepID=A0AC34GA54_9BILA
SSDVLSKHGFSTLEKAQKHVQQKYANLADGLFEKHVSHRIRICPSDVYNNPDLYLKPGDHIQRRLDAFFPFANHEGVYLGERKVAHINTESSTATGITVLTEKRLADARVDSFETFGATKEVRIIVHCIRRQSRDDICETAIRITKGKLLEEENYGKGKYNLLLQNCQHFASYCVLGIEWMSDKKQLFEKVVATLAVTGIAISLVYAVATRNDKIEDKDKQKSIRASKSNRDK